MNPHEALFKNTQEVSDLKTLQICSVSVDWHSCPVGEVLGFLILR